MNCLARCSIARRGELQDPLLRGTRVKAGANGECVRPFGMSLPGIQGTRLPRQGPLLRVHAEYPKPADAQHLHQAAHEPGTAFVVLQALQRRVPELQTWFLSQTPSSLSMALDSNRTVRTAVF